MRLVCWASCTLVALVLAWTPAAAQDVNPGSCEMADVLIADSVAKAQADFARAAELAKGLEGQGILNSISQIIGILNPVPTSGGDVAGNLFFSVCERLIGTTITAGVQATKTALEISMAIGASQTGGIQGMVNSNLTTGQKHLDTANALVQWKEENCSCQVEAQPPDSVSEPEDESGSEPDSVTTTPGSGGGDGSGATDTGSGTTPVGETFSGDGVTVHVLDNDSAQITTDCPAQDKRIQLRTTGTWSTKSDGSSSVVVDGFRVGASYEVRVRCDFQSREPLEFDFPGR